MTPYRTKEGDMVDAICKAHYGSETMARTVYEANPGLAAHGSLLPMGLVVLLPDPAPEPVRQPIRLWS
ncbi:tail protein X [Thalassobius sp. I31.1]|uniref:tail protein X n=1 Tax=Thalassobius sp. I31.1 TaxID=2109912 RepID=UPI000D19E267|nr:tail protein X [Thalassobius sp. I31.1]